MQVKFDRAQANDLGNERKFIDFYNFVQTDFNYLKGSFSFCNF